MLDTSELICYVNDEFGGNISKASRAFGISCSGLCRVMAGQRNAGVKIIEAVLSYYSKHNTGKRQYALLNQMLTQVNKKEPTNMKTKEMSCDRLKGVKQIIETPCIKAANALIAGGE